MPRVMGFNQGDTMCQNASRDKNGKRVHTFERPIDMGLKMDYYLGTFLLANILYIIIFIKL